MTEQKTHVTRVRRAAYLDVDAVPILATADDGASNVAVSSCGHDDQSRLVTPHGMGVLTPPLPTPLFRSLALPFSPPRERVRVVCLRAGSGTRIHNPYALEQSRPSDSNADCTSHRSVGATTSVPRQSSSTPAKVGLAGVRPVA